MVMFLGLLGQLGAIAYFCHSICFECSGLGADMNFARICLQLDKLTLTYMGWEHFGERVQWTVVQWTPSQLASLPFQSLSSLLKTFILLTYSWFTMLCQLLLYSTVIQLCKYTHAHTHIHSFSYSFLLWFIIGYIVPCAIQVGPCCLVILHIIVCFYQPQKPPFPCQPWVCSLCLWVRFCFIDGFICVIF